jgi:hypothetical protein
VISNSSSINRVLVSSICLICFHLLLRPAMEARGEGGMAALWDLGLTGDGEFLLHLQAQPQWSVGDH